MRPPEELLYDSEASLRLVDNAINELSVVGAELDRDARGLLEHVTAQPGGFNDLSRMLLTAYVQTMDILTKLSESRGVLEQAAIERLQHMDGKLHEVSSATEVATTDILDGLGRAVELVDKMCGAQSGEPNEQLAASLREELYGAMVHLQFQDITTQQLNHLSHLMLDMRERLTQVVAIFAPYAAALTAPGGARVAPDATLVDAATVGAFDPNATVAPSADRQAVADEIFARDRKSA